MDVGNWAQALAIIGSNLVLVLVMFGTTVSIWLHTDKKIEQMQKEMMNFHGKMVALEERSKGKK
jgi:hypothetical protein